ncbi:MAG TPA: PP2C family protein-serine/threonine phosphatase [Actinomycetota bacterium]
MKRSTWLLAGMALPLLGLWLLRAEPRLDVHMEHHPGHFWLVTGVAAINVALGLAVGEAARRHRDARLLLVSMTFVASAGFLGLHALATPQVLLAGRTPGFVIATPVGLFVGACFAALSSLDLEGARGTALVRRQALLRGGLGLLLVLWAVLSLGGLPPFDRVIAEDAAEVPVALLGLGGVVLYVTAAARYWRLYRRRPAPVLAGVLVAFLLLGEAMVAVAIAPSWHASWWEWHLLMAAGFGLVAWAAYYQYRRERAPTSLFDAVSLDQTAQRVREHYSAAVSAMVEELRVHHQAHDMPAGLVAAQVAERYGLVGGQGQVLQQVAEAIARLVDEQEEATRQRESIEQELRVAHRIQQQFLPHTLPKLAGWEIAALYRPARAVGGDFYDFIELPGGRIGIAIGDVTDKGVPAALGMATTHAVLRAEAPRLLAPGEVLQRANELLVGELPAAMFVTCMYAVLDPATGRLDFANAGHCLPYLTADGKVTELHATGMPLGLMPGMRYDEAEQLIGDGGQLLLHSDGLTEAHGPGRVMFGLPRLVDLLGRADGDGVIDRLLAGLADFTGPAWEQEDDITLVTLRRVAQR